MLVRPNPALVGVGLRLINKYINSLAYVRVKWEENECFKMEKCETRLYHILLGFQCAYGHSNEIGIGRKRMEITWALVCR